MRFLTTGLLLCSLLPGSTLAFQTLPAQNIRTVSRPRVLQRSFGYSRSARNPATLIYAEQSLDQELDGGKKAIVGGYMASKKLYLLLSLLLLGLTRDYRKFTTVSGFFIAAGLSHILSVATTHDRLASDTYKRLNIGLMGYNLLSLFTIPGEVGLFLGTAKAYVYSVAAFVVQSYGAHTAYEGWRRGLQKGADPKKQLTEGIVETAKTVLPTKERGTMYRNFLLFFLGESFYMLYKIVISLRPSPMKASLLTGAFARRGLIVTMLYSLKDAGERDRLKGTTFIQSDYLIGLWLFMSKSNAVSSIAR